MRNAVPGPRRLGAVLRMGPGSRLLARAGVAVSVGCALLHGLLLVGTPAGWLPGLHAAVALACLPCAVHLWRRPGLPAWVAHGSLALTMAVVLPLAMAVTMAVSPASGPHAHMTMSATGPAAGVQVAAPLLALLSLGLAAVAIAGRWLGPQPSLPQASRPRPAGAQASGASVAGGAVRRVPQA